MPHNLKRNLDDFEPVAQRRLPRFLYRYVSGGAEPDASLQENCRAFTERGFMPRVLNDVSGRDQTTQIFGGAYAAPFGVTPMGSAALCAYHGDIVLARAANPMNVPMILSALSVVSLEDVRRENHVAWYQAYLAGYNSRVGPLVDRVAADARIARDSGVDGVIVSNHGGRQLDRTVSALRTLPEIAADANGMTAMLDRGIQRGTDTGARRTVCLHRAAAALRGGHRWRAGLQRALVVTVTDARMERILRRAGWPLRRLGNPCNLGNTLAVAGYLNISTEILAGICNEGGLASPVLWEPVVLTAA